MARTDWLQSRATAHEYLTRARRVQALAPPAKVQVPAAPRPDIDPADRLAVFDALVTDAGLVQVARPLFRDGYYKQAVYEGYVYVNNMVKARARSTQDGRALMFAVFDQDRPVLRFNPLRTTSHRDEQEGYKLTFGGVMQGIRNPRVHEHTWLDTPDVAIEMLVWANHLMRVLQKATHVRTQRKTR